jgi:anti-sigma factor RsiW
MTPELLHHLSEEELHDVLIGLGTPQADAHLEGCAACRRHVAEFRSEMENFNQALFAWSQAQPEPRLAAAVRRKARRTLYAAAGWALAAACFVVIGLPAWNHYRNESAHPVAVSVAPQEDSEAQIAQDNELLQAVDAALNAPEESPVRHYHLSEGPQSSLRERPESRNQ